MKKILIFLSLSVSLLFSSNLEETLKDLEISGKIYSSDENKNEDPNYYLGVELPLYSDISLLKANILELEDYIVKLYINKKEKSDLDIKYLNFLKYSFYKYQLEIIKLNIQKYSLQYEMQPREQNYFYNLELNKNKKDSLEKVILYFSKTEMQNFDISDNLISKDELFSSNLNLLLERKKNELQKKKYLSENESLLLSLYSEYDYKNRDNTNNSKNNYSTIGIKLKYKPLVKLDEKIRIKFLSMNNNILDIEKKIYEKYENTFIEIENIDYQTLALKTLILNWQNSESESEYKNSVNNLEIEISNVRILSLELEKKIKILELMMLWYLKQKGCKASFF